MAIDVLDRFFSFIEVPSMLNIIRVCVVIAGSASALNSCHADADEDAVVQFLKTREASVTRDRKKPGMPVVEVALGGRRVPRTKSTNEVTLKLPSLKNLTKVFLSNTDLSDDGLKGFGGLQKMETLWIDGANISDLSLKEVGKLKKLETLILDGTKLTGKGLKELAALTELELLSLSQSRALSREFNTGIEALSKLPKLRTLVLSEANVTDLALPYIAKLTRLNSLDLAHTEITDDGLKALVPLSDIRILSLGHTKVTGKGAKQLQDLLPNCEIRGPFED
jgi:Leucine-rich repeat (LRR) protein